MPGHSALARRSVFRLDCRIPAQLGGRYAGGTDANQQLTFARSRLREFGLRSEPGPCVELFTCIAFIFKDR